MGKLQNIIDGWKYYAFEDKAIEEMALKRAKICGKCEHAVKGVVAQFIDDDIKDIKGMVCNLCTCPLSGLTRSPNEKCKADKWQ